MKLTLITAVLAVVGISAAHAQPNWYPDENDGERAVDVYTGDLDLSDPRDRAEAAWRVHHATAIACEPFPDVRATVDVRDYHGCRADAYDDAITDLEAARAHRHRHGHVTTREYPTDEP